MEYVEEEVKSACQRWNAAAHGAAAAPIALMDEGHELVATLSERVKTLETMQEAPSARCKVSILAGRRAVIGLSEQPKCKECIRPGT